MTPRRIYARHPDQGSRNVVDGEVDWREWTDPEQNRPEVVVITLVSSPSTVGSKRTRTPDRHAPRCGASVCGGRSVDEP
jgi:hypothetical protein